MSVIIDGTAGVTFNDASIQNTAATGFGFKNRIINGAMVIDQRNAGASVTPTNGQYLLDRFKYYSTQTSKVSVQQNAGSVTPPAGFKNYLGVTSLSAYSVTASDYFSIAQLIEGFNMADLGYGAAGASTVTFSFWVYSSLTGTFGASLTNDAANYAYPFTYTISAANTWEQKFITITGATAGTWLTTNVTGIQVIWSLGAGATFSGTPGAWVSAGFLPSATGAVSVVGTNGATFYITGVQLEKGSTATSFDYRPYGTELALCQRYYYRTQDDGGVTILISGGVESASIMAGSGGSFPATMRAIPTMAMGSGLRVYSFGTATQTTSLLGNRCNTTSMSGEFSMTGATGGQAAVIFRSAASGYLEFSAEL
jgi:hypothetical protein